MELLKIATEWAKSEVFSTRFFVFFAIPFLIASVGFWQLGKSEVAKAYIFPTLIVGLLLMTIGVGLFYTNKSRIKNFEIAYHKDSSAFLSSEIKRAESTLEEYRTIVFKVIPFLIIISSLLIVFLDKPIYRASAISAIAMFVVILLVDGTAQARMNDYYHKLKVLEKAK